MKTVSIILIALGSLFLAGCNPVKSSALADAAVVDFHANFDKENYDKIFDDAHPDFKAAQPKAKVVEFAKSVREKMGKVKSTSRTNWNIKSNNMKTNVNFSYATEFENGAGTEKFIYRITDGKATLLSWNIKAKERAVPSDKKEGASPENPATAKEPETQ